MMHLMENMAREHARIERRRGVFRVSFVVTFAWVAAVLAWVHFAFEGRPFAIRDPLALLSDREALFTGALVLIPVWALWAAASLWARMPAGRSK